jgi:hypothetical protein
MAVRRCLALCVWTVAAWAASGGAVAGEPPSAKASRVWQQIQVVAPEADGTPVRLDVVLVRDVAWMARLPVTAPQWFAARQALQQSAGKGLQVISLQVRQASATQSIRLPALASRAAGAFVYADLASAPGAPAAPLAPHPCVKVTLSREGLTQAACP